jgi:glycosyltransferase involved in cell wall biosynthesis
VKFVYQQWLGYGAQKNFANTLAQYSYILSLDADEALSDTLNKSMLKFKQIATADAYRMNRHTNYCGKWIDHCGWYPDAKIRLWKKEEAQWSLDKVHEKIIVAPNATVLHIEGDILHYTYDSIMNHIAIANQYTTYVAEGYFERKKKVSLVKILFAPAWGFFRDYFIRMGFLDGYYGFVICVVAAFSTFLKYVKLRQLYLNEK